MPTTTGAARVAATGLLVPLLVGAVVAVALGRVRQPAQPTGIAVNVAGFSGPQTVKVWLATGAALLAVVQLVSALAMWGRLGRLPPAWIGTAAPLVGPDRVPAHRPGGGALPVRAGLRDLRHPRRSRTRCSAASSSARSR